MTVGQHPLGDVRLLSSAVLVGEWQCCVEPAFASSKVMLPPGGEGGGLGLGGSHRALSHPPPPRCREDDRGTGGRGGCRVCVLLLRGSSPTASRTAGSTSCRGPLMRRTPPLQTSRTRRIPRKGAPSNSGCGRPPRATTATRSTSSSLLMLTWSCPNASHCASQPPGPATKGVAGQPSPVGQS